MAGGPLNNIIDGTRPKLLVRTAVQVSNDMLSWFTNMTCLYDPYYVPDPTRVVLPIAFLDIKAMRETWTNEVSDQRVILYEPQAEATAKELASPLREGAVQSIVDSTVRKPKTYNIEAIVPYLPTKRMKDGISAVSGVLSAFVSQFGGEGAQTFVNHMQAAVGIADLASSAIESVSKLPSFNGVAYTNMNSLEAMAESCRPLCMKMWTGYDYKFVEIVSMEKNKVGQEDDVFRVNIQVRERPVLTVSKPKGSSQPTKATVLAVALAFTQRALAAPLKTFSGVVKGSGEVGIDK